MWFTRAIPLTNFAVASSALGFQVFVLYPWHHELDHSFHELKKEHTRVLDAVNDISREADPKVRKSMRDSILGRLGMGSGTETDNSSKPPAAQEIAEAKR